MRNPFSFSETADMIRLVLAGRENYTLLPIPDLDTLFSAARRRQASAAVNRPCRCSAW